MRPVHGPVKTLNNACPLESRVELVIKHVATVPVFPQEGYCTGDKDMTASLRGASRSLNCRLSVRAHKRPHLTKNSFTMRQIR